MSPRFLSTGIAFMTWVCIGCGHQSMEDSESSKHHDTASHMPISLGDLSKKARACLAELKQDGANPQLKSKLTNLISWAPEFAAETNIGEQRWIPIYQLSEEIRLSIRKDANRWDTRRVNQITELCRLSEQAWQSLNANERIPRFQVRHHSHSHGDHDHSHGDHDHSHGDHDHNHGDHDHNHGSRHSNQQVTQ